MNSLLQKVCPTLLFLTTAICVAWLARGKNSGNITTQREVAPQNASTPSPAKAKKWKSYTDALVSGDVIKAQELWTNRADLAARLALDYLSDTPEGPDKPLYELIAKEALLNLADRDPDTCYQILSTHNSIPPAIALPALAALAKIRRFPINGLVGPEHLNVANEIQRRDIAASLLVGNPKHFANLLAASPSDLKDVILQDLLALSDNGFEIDGPVRKFLTFLGEPKSHAEKLLKIRAMADTDTLAAVGLAVASPDQKSRVELLEKVFTWAGKNTPTTIIKAAFESLPEAEKAQLLSSAIKSISNRPAPEITLFLTNLPDNLKFVGASEWLKEADPREALLQAQMWLTAAEGSWQRKALETTMPLVLAKQAHTDIEDAINHSKAFPPGPLRDNCLCAVAGELARIDPLRSSEILATQKPSQVRDQAVRRLVNELEGDIEGSLQWAASIQTPSLRASALRVVLEKAARDGVLVPNEILADKNLQPKSADQ